MFSVSKLWLTQYFVEGFLWGPKQTSQQWELLDESTQNKMQLFWILCPIEALFQEGAWMNIKGQTMGQTTSNDFMKEITCISGKEKKSKRMRWKQRRKLFKKIRAKNYLKFWIWITSTWKAGGITYLAAALSSCEFWLIYISLYTICKSSWFCSEESLLINLEPSIDKHSVKI